MAFSFRTTHFPWSAIIPSSSPLLPSEHTISSCLALISLLSLLSPSSALSSHFEGFELPSSADEDDVATPSLLPLTLTLSDFDYDPPPPPPSDLWDEDEFEGLPAPDATAPPPPPAPDAASLSLRPFAVEILLISFLVSFSANYFAGSRRNSGITLAWTAHFAAKNSVLDKNFGILGAGDEKDTPLLLRESHDAYKLYAVGRRYCIGALAAIKLKPRHDLISRICRSMSPSGDAVALEVYMNEDAMDQVVFALARKRVAKAMHKEARDLWRFAGTVAAPAGRRWVADELLVLAESRDLAGDLITETAIDQIFGDKVFETHGKGLISLHFSDQHSGSHKKILKFKFALPDANSMAQLKRLMALVPYYVDLIGRYKLSSQARSKTEAARLKAAQESQKALQIARQEALQMRKAERRKMMDAETMLSVEAIYQKEEKEHARQMKKPMPRVKMTQAR